MSAFDERLAIDIPGTLTDGPILALDFENVPELPRNFRSTKDPYKTKAEDPTTRYGLDGLNASAARQFSELDLKISLERMHSQVYVVDLRQECHGFVNGSPGSWYGLRNQTNAGKSDVEIAEQERELLSRLGSASAVKMHRIMHKTNGRIDKASTHEVSISRAETERELVERMGLRYAHFYITDHQHPNDKGVEQFVDFAQNLPEDAWLHFHCRSGSGRTSTFMILYDIIRNATAVSLDDIIHRQALLGSKDLYRLSELDAKRWKHDMAVARQEFITTFYDFVVDRDKYGHLPWIEWLAQRGLVK